MQHFKIEEFACPCCGQCPMDPKFLAALDLARSGAKVVFKITSGYRCEQHNFKVGGVKGSAHCRGLAADIQVLDSVHRYRILSELFLYNFRRIGIAKSFIHVDVDQLLPGPVVFLYDK